MRIAIMLGVLFTSAGLWAQGIAPPIAEFRGDKASGSFNIQNTTDSLMLVILTTKTFVVDELGHVHYSPLDKSIKLKMGASSFTIRPHDNRMIFYNASFPSAPTSFSIISTMTKVEKVANGMRVGFIFPHMVYVYQKDKLNRSDIDLTLTDGVLHIHNSSQKLGRVQRVQAAKEEFGGFPIYPGQTRELAMSGATKATVNFEDGFKAEIQ